MLTHVRRFRHEVARSGLDGCRGWPLRNAAGTLCALALQRDRQLGLGRQVAAVGRRDDLAVALGQGCSGAAACASFELTPEQEAELDDAIAEANRDGWIPAEQVIAELRRR